MKIELIKPYRYSEDGINATTIGIGHTDIADRWALKAIANGYTKPENNKVLQPKNNKKSKK
jgi:hypothetical protein